ncbi:MAG TPA: pyrimidine reductase family protein [Nocardioidaceae bacterium]|nr:pyrimidine reductase family protein [Nocardioidaceae bacterium]
MRLLLNDLDVTPAAGADVTLDQAAIARLYAYPKEQDRPAWVRANFVSTLDGAATGEDSKAGSINTRADREVFALMRAHADVILVGAGTARAESYRRPTAAERWRRLGLRAERPPHPALAVVSRSADVPPLLAKHHEDTGEVILVTCTEAGQEAISLARETLGDDHVVVLGGSSVDLATAVGELAQRGLGRVLCEGGPHLLHDVIAAGCLDELCLTLSPKVIAGEHLRILAGDPVDGDFVPRVLIESEGTLLGRWLRPR